MKSPFAKVASGLAATALALSLSACSLLFKPKVTATYQLPAHNTLHMQTNRSGKPTIDALHIQTPESNRVIDSDRIVIAQDSGRLTAWLGLRWTDPAPVLLRDRLVEVFSHDGRVSGVSTDSESLASGLELRGTLRAFQLEHRDGEPVVAVRFDARLIDRKSLITVANRRFEVVQVTGTRRAVDVVAAFGLAASAIASQIVEWTLQSNAIGARIPNALVIDSAQESAAFFGNSGQLITPVRTNEY